MMFATTAQRADAFRQSIRANIAYWRRSLLTAPDLAKVSDADWRNVLQAIHYASLERTARVAGAQLAIDLFDRAQRRGAWREWGALLQRLADGLTDEPAVRCRLLQQIGQCRLVDHQPQVALDILRSAERLAVQTGEGELIARSHANLCECLRLLGQDDDAERMGQLALADLATQADTAGLDRVRATVLSTLGILAGRLGRPTEGEARLLEAVAVLDATRYPLEASRIYTALTQLLWEAGRPADALPYLDRARAGLSALPEALYDRTMIGLGQGALLFSLERWSEAETAFKAIAVEQLRRQGYWMLVARTANDLANVYQQQGRLIEAEVLLIEAVALLRGLGDKVELANSLLTQGEVVDAQGRRGEAEPLWREAVAFAERYPTDPNARRYAAKGRRYLGE